jgi:hypothetical protein
VYERTKTLLNFSPCSTLHLTFSISKRLTFTKPTSIRRTSGHCLGTFVAANLNLCSPPPVKSSVCRYFPHFLFSVSPFFSSKGLKFSSCLQENTQHQRYKTMYSVNDYQEKSSYLANIITKRNRPIHSVGIMLS